MALEFAGKDGTRIASKTQLIRRPCADLYRVWRKLPQWPRFMPFLQGVLQEGNRSRWQLRDGTEWIMDQTDDVMGRALAWRALDDTSAPSTVAVRLDEAPVPGAAEVRVIWRFEAGAMRPAGGHRIAALAIDEALEVFRILMEVRPSLGRAVQVGMLS